MNLLINKFFDFFHEDKCNFCPPLKQNPSTKDYLVAIKLWIKLVNQGDFKFIAGDCPLSDIDEHLDKEDIYVIEHYFKCKCGKYYQSGICIRSSVPIVRTIKSIPQNIKERFSGNFSELHLENI